MLASVKGDLRLNDFMTRSLQQITHAVNMTVSELDNMAKKVGQNIDTSGLDLIRDKIARADLELENAVKEQERLKKVTAETKEQYSSLGSVIKTAVSALGVQKMVNLSDQMTQTTARLNLMNNGQDDIDDLKNKIFASAQRSRVGYMDQASVIASLGMQAGEAFNNDNNQIIAFSENLSKLFTTSGLDSSGISSTMYNLTQSLSSGSLLGNDYRILKQNAPQMIQYIQDYYGVTRKELDDMVSKGKVSAEGIKNAIFKATDDITTKFNDMPMTWGQVWTMTINKIIKLSQPLLNFISFLAKNWSILEPIIVGVAGAVGLYAGALAIHNTHQAISNGLKTIATIASVAHGTATATEAAATTGMTAAQVSFNAALYACPLTWIIVAIIAIIAVIYATVAAINKVKGTTISATGIIMGIIATAGAFIWNLFLGLVDLSLGVVKYIANPWIAFANFFGNLFNDPIGSVIHLFGDFADSILGVIETIAKAIDKVFGSNLAGSVQNWRSSLNTMIEDTANKYGNGSYEKVMDNLDLSSESLGLSRWEYGNAWNTGYSFGEGLEDKVSGMFGDGLDISNIGNVDNVSNVEGEVDVSSEDLKLLRELAEQQYIQNYISNDPVLYITTGDINENADADYLIRSVRTALKEEAESSMEGVPVG